METLQNEARKLAVKLNEAQLKQFELYLEELIAYNTHTNITAITDPKEIGLKHFVDSLSVVPAIPKEATTLVDIGSGAGFPGLAIKIARPELEVTLIESAQKKVAFLEHIIKKLNLTTVKAIQTRAEEAGRNNMYREQYDVAVARAVSQLPTLCEYVLPFVKVGGIFIAQKNADTPELKESEKALAELGGTIKEIQTVHISNLPPRQLIIIEKISPTPEKYPRRTGVPLKKPL